MVWTSKTSLGLLSSNPSISVSLMVCQTLSCSLSLCLDLTWKWFRAFEKVIMLGSACKSEGSSTYLQPVWSDLEMFKVTNCATKEPKYLVTFWATLEHIFETIATFGQLLANKWATFYSNIWSHFLQPTRRWSRRRPRTYLFKNVRNLLEL